MQTIVTYKLLIMSSASRNVELNKYVLNKLCKEKQTSAKYIDCAPSRSYKQALVYIVGKSWHRMEEAV